LSPVRLQSEGQLARQFRGLTGHFGVFSPGASLALTQYDAEARYHLSARARRQRPIAMTMLNLKRPELAALLAPVLAGDRGASGRQSEPRRGAPTCDGSG
jgi:hypothetical protein